ncbi:TonB-dependent receptor [Sphingomonas sp.]|uniref:TonB-dependent receptor n=1 Tax=Sphingomonas sp. TaxID=28214 RepID=UPI0031D48364
MMITHIRAVPSFRALSLASAGLVLACVAAASSARAEDRQTASKQESGTAPDDIVVTAQKREGTLQTTPIAMSVLGTQELRDQGVHDLATLSRAAPDLNFRQATGQAVLTIRGISSSDTSDVGDPAVTVSKDGVVSNRPYALGATLYDLSRVEVLRGPQGTLTGRSAVGGAINLISAEPQKTQEGYAAIGLGDYGAVNAEAMANVPLSDRVQVRLAGMTRYNNGYRSIAPFGRADDDVSQSGRMTIAAQPGDRLKLSATVEYTHLGGIGQAQQYLPLVYASNGAVVHAMPPIPSYSTFAVGAKPHLNAADLATRWRADYAFDGATLTYIGGYERIDYRQGYFSALAASSTYNYNERPVTWNQELRLASTASGPLTWLVGGSFFNEENTLFNYTLRPSRVTGLMVRGNTYDYRTTSRSLAGFGSVSIEVAPGLKLTGGLRYSDDRKQRDGFTYTANIAVDPVTYTPLSAAGYGHWSKVTYDAKAEWQVTPGHLAYAKFDTGYKPGGYTNVNTYGPETVSAWELGSKNQFADGRVRFNVAAFYQDYRNQQLTQSVTVGDRVFQQVLNAGRSTIWGIEPELTTDITGLGRLDASVQYLHARLKDFVNLGVQYAGNTLPQAPDWSLTLGYRRGVALGGGTLTLDARSRMQGRSYLDFTNYGEQTQAGYTMTSVNLSFAPNERRWQIEAFIRNIENRQVLQEAAVNTYARSYRFSYGAPRTFGGKLSFWF